MNTFILLHCECLLQMHGVQDVLQSVRGVEGRKRHKKLFFFVFLNKQTCLNWDWVTERNSPGEAEQRDDKLAPKTNRTSIEEKNSSMKNDVQRSFSASGNVWLLIAEGRSKEEFGCADSKVPSWGNTHWEGLTLNDPSPAKTSFSKFAQLYWSGCGEDCLSLHRTLNQTLTLTVSSHFTFVNSHKFALSSEDTLNVLHSQSKLCLVPWAAMCQQIRRFEQLCNFSLYFITYGGSCTLK